ncbi:MAG TPA: hypothetical protein VMU26_08840 [Candidatus Polarisedimenticolia bacterium]|nr:hypothetical protein [Candidatus Polarisedimenticolia bacterium]
MHTLPSIFRGGFHAEGNVVTVSRVDQDTRALAGAGDVVVRLHTPGVASASLHSAGAENGGLLIERGKQRPDAIGRKGDGSGCAQLLVDNLLIDHLTPADS